MANAYFGDHPGRLEISGECSNKPCLTRTPPSLTRLIVSKITQNQECGATKTSNRVTNSTDATASFKNLFQTTMNKSATNKIGKTTTTATDTRKKTVKTTKPRVFAAGLSRKARKAKNRAAEARIAEHKAKVAAARRAQRNAKKGIVEEAVVVEEADEELKPLIAGLFTLLDISSTAPNKALNAGLLRATCRDLHQGHARPYGTHLRRPLQQGRFCRHHSFHRSRENYSQGHASFQA